MTRRKPTVIDLFCGAGGMSHGFINENFRVLLGVDCNESAIRTFSKNHRNAKTICADMKTVSVPRIRKTIGKSKIDVVIGGPPCQGFSMAGKRIPNDPRNSLFREYLRIVKGLKPGVFVMENVRGLLSMKNSRGSRVIDIILKEFGKLGYITDYYSVNTADYGIPQKRHRIFIIGRKPCFRFSFPARTHCQNPNGSGLRKWEAVGKLLTDKEQADPSLFYSRKLIAGFKRRERMNKERELGFGWRFLDTDAPSSTISARYYKDGAEALVKYSATGIRMLSINECARIQSFPKCFKFEGSKRNIYQQIGNAVPPGMARVIAKSVRAGFGE